MIGLELELEVLRTTVILATITITMAVRYIYFS